MARPLMLTSTRAHIALLGITLAILNEVLYQNGIIVREETLAVVAGLLATLMGVDTLRPLGQKGEAKAPKMSDVLMAVLAVGAGGLFQLGHLL